LGPQSQITVVSNGCISETVRNRTRACTLFLLRMTDTMISQNIPPGAPSIFVNSSANVYKLCKFLIFENAGYMTYSNDCIKVRFALSICMFPSDVLVNAIPREA
jgi:hypothetical protein